MGKIANAVPRTAVEGRYRGKRNSTLTKTYKRHLLTIMAGMGMFNIIYSKNYLNEKLNSSCGLSQ